MSINSFKVFVLLSALVALSPLRAYSQPRFDITPLISPNGVHEETSGVKISDSASIRSDGEIDVGIYII